MAFKAEDFKDDEEFATYVKALVDPLEASKTGLQADITKLKEQAKSFEGLDIDALRAAQTKLEELERQKHDKESDAEKALRLAKEQHDSELKELKNSVETLMGTNKKLLVDDTLRAHLVAARVKPELIPSVMKMIEPDVSLLTEDGKQVAKIGDQDLATYVGVWAASDLGKNFVVAKVNSGGGGGGGGKETQDSHAIFYDKKSPHYNLTEQIRLSKTNPELHKLLKSQY